MPELAKDEWEKIYTGLRHYCNRLSEDIEESDEEDSEIRFYEQELSAVYALRKKLETAKVWGPHVR